MPIRCEIVSQDRLVFQGDVDIVILPGSAGQMGILPNHSPLLTSLQYGIVTIRKGKLEEIFAVAGGIAEVQPDQVTILADSAENVEDIDIQRAEASRQRAEEALKAGIDMDEDEYLAIQAALRRSDLRLNVVRRYRQGLNFRK